MTKEMIMLEFYKTNMAKEKDPVQRKLYKRAIDKLEKKMKAGA